MYKKIYRNMCLMSFVTLLLSTLLIIAACYTYFESSYRNELKIKAELTADALNTSENKQTALERASDTQSKITLTDAQGNVLYDSVHSNMKSFDTPILTDGTTNGEYYCSICRDKLTYYSVVLADNTVLTVSGAAGKMPHVFYSILIAVLFIMGLMYILTAVASSALTENILKPIRSINPLSPNSLDVVYEEIQPFLKKIVHQNEEIDRQTEKVTEQKARLRTVMDTVNEGLVLIDKDGEVLTINAPALLIFDKAEVDVKHKSCRHLTDKESIRSIINLSLSGHKGSILYEKEERTYEIFHSPVYERDTVAGAVLLLFDVTGRTAAEKIRREFTANVSHELKTPLTTIHGYAQIIDKGIAKPEDIAGFAGKIEKESRRLMALVNDIIELSHLDEERDDAPKQNISLKSVAAEVMESLAAKAEDMNVKVELRGEDSTVYANLSQITEMVYNLVDNAIKYNRKGGSVTISLIQKGLEISDTGIGIPAKYLDRIFERFFRVDKSHSKMIGGTGLGLSIVKHIAKANGAAISVESTPGHGSTFKVSFDNEDVFI